MLPILAATLATKIDLVLIDPPYDTGARSAWASRRLSYDDCRAELWGDVVSGRRLVTIVIASGDTTTSRGVQQAAVYLRIAAPTFLVPAAPDFGARRTRDPWSVMMLVGPRHRCRALGQAASRARRLRRRMTYHRQADARAALMWA